MIFRRRTAEAEMPPHDDRFTVEEACEIWSGLSDDDLAVLNVLERAEAVIDSGDISGRIRLAPSPVEASLGRLGATGLILGGPDRFMIDQGAVDETYTKWAASRRQQP